MSDNLKEDVQQTAKQTSDIAGKYLTFKIGPEAYGLEILKVREIIGLMAITAVPRTPTYIKGVINLRGKVIPVIDLRTKFGMEEKESTDETCIIVVDIGEVEMGIIVDAVSEVLEIGSADVEDVPTFGSGVSTDYFLGMGKVDEKVIILLDISKVLGKQGTLDIAAIAKTDEANQGK